MRRVSLVIAAMILSALPIVASGSGKHGGGRSSHTRSSHTKSSHSKSSHKSSKVPKAKVVHVKGYVKKNGTRVAPHDRTAPNKTKNDNWTTKGNVNPETGKAGTKPRDGEKPKSKH